MAKANHVEIPYLDPSVQHVGISRLRALNVTQLRELDKTLLIQDNDKPLAVLLKYKTLSSNAGATTKVRDTVKNPIQRGAQ